MRLALWVLVLVTQLSCSASSGAVGSAILNTAIALTASGASRASGGCYAACPVGTFCDTRTGMCEELPCRGRCRSDERCETVSGIPQCMPAHSPATDLVIQPKKPTDAER